MGNEETEGGMVQGLAAIAISVVFAGAVGLLILYFLPGTSF